MKNCVKAQLALQQASLPAWTQLIRLLIFSLADAASSLSGALGRLLRSPSSLSGALGWTRCCAVPAAKHVGAERPAWCAACALARTPLCPCGQGAG